MQRLQSGVIFFGSEHITSCSHPLYLSLQSTQGELAYRLGAKLLRWVSLLLDPLRVFQARILEWVAMPSPMGSSQPRDESHVSYVFCIDRQVHYH